MVCHLSNSTPNQNTKTQSEPFPTDPSPQSPAFVHPLPLQTKQFALFKKQKGENGESFSKVREAEFIGQKGGHLARAWLIIMWDNMEGEPRMEPISQASKGVHWGHS